MTHAWLVRPLWVGATILSLVGVVTVAARFAFPDDLVLRLQPQRERLLAALGRPDAAAAARRPVLERFDRRFAEHRSLTRWHILPGGVFIILAPLQFVRPLRRRYPAVHRWSGRLLLVVGTTAAVTGLWFGIFLPIAGAAETAVIVLVGVLFLVAVARAFVAIRRRDLATHREWMLRAFGVMVAVPGTRVLGALLDVATAPAGLDVVRLFAIDLWVTWALVLGVTEWWIRTTRPAGRAAFAAGPQA